jgi:acyl-CoA reductase-like NAD-dependent aldehyde dehydrogenase
MSLAATDLPGTKSPLDGRDLPPVAWSDPASVKGAIDAARAAQPAWAALRQSERNDLVRAIGRRLLEKRAEVAEIQEAETGRPQTSFLVSEMLSLLNHVEGAISVCAQATATERVRLSPIDFPGKRLQIEAVPRGVVAIIAPWNYPVSNFFKSLWPALLSGNAVVLKPSEWTPRTGAWLAEQCQAVLPAGVVQLVQGGGDVGAALIDGGADSLVFTGSLATGRKVAARCAERMVPCSAELGGKDPAIVLADADLERTAAGIAFYGIGNSGQDCSSVERVYVENAVADAFVARLGQIVGAIKVADGTGAGDIGPLMNPNQLRIVTEHVEDAVAKGARVVCGGRPTGQGTGYLPTVLDGCTNDMRVMREETFGPVLPVCRVQDAEEAVAHANDTDYGLCGSVWTKDVAKGEALVKRIHVGVAMVNSHSFTGTMAEPPWNGTKGTGTGIANSKHAYHSFVRRRTLLVDKNASPDAWWFPVDQDLTAFANAVCSRALGNFWALFTLLPLLGKRTKTVKAFGK